jgi:hypothetical protein
MLWLWLILQGRRLAGKIERVPGVLFVGTMVYHFWGVPLVPLATYASIDLPYGQRYGVAIPLSIASLVLTYVRALLYMLFFFVLCYTLSGAEAVAVGILIATALSLAGTYVYAALARPTFERAIELALRLNLPDEHWVRLHEQYGKTADLADPRRLAAQEAARAFDLDSDGPAVGEGMNLDGTQPAGWRRKVKT